MGSHAGASLFFFRLTRALTYEYVQALLEGRASHVKIFVIMCQATEGGKPYGDDEGGRRLAPQHESVDTSFMIKAQLFLLGVGQQCTIHCMLDPAPCALGVTVLF